MTIDQKYKLIDQGIRAALRGDPISAFDSVRVPGSVDRDAGREAFESGYRSGEKTLAGAMAKVNRAARDVAGAIKESFLGRGNDGGISS